MLPELVVVSASLTVAGLAVGLWWGERGRRQAAERHLATGYPSGTPRAVVSGPVPEAEDRLVAAAEAARGEMIERGYEDMATQLRAKGIPFDAHDLRRDVARMVAGFDVEAPE